MLVVRDGRVVHHEIDPGLEAKGVRVCGIATCDGDDVRELLGAASRTSQDAFTVLHDAFLAGGALVQVPDGVVVDDPILVLHWCEGDGRASFPHTVVSLGEHSEATVLDRFGSPETEHLVDAVTELLVADDAHLRYLSVQQHGSRTWHLGLQRALVGRNAVLRTSAVALGGDYARLRSETVLQGEGGESDQLAVYFADGSQMLDFRTLQDHDAPRTRSDLLFKGAVEDIARSVYSGLVHLRPDRPEVERVADQPQPRADRRRERGVDPEPRDRGQRREVLARFDRRPHRRRSALLPREPGHPTRRRRAPDRARLLRRRVRAPAGERAVGRSAPFGGRQVGTPREEPVGELRRLCSRDDLAPGTARRFDVDGHRVALVRIADDFYAIGDTCSHADFSLSEGDVWGDEREIECPKHGSTFSLTTGEPQTLPATQPVPVYEIVVEGDDVKVVVP